MVSRFEPCVWLQDGTVVERVRQQSTMDAQVPAALAILVVLAAIGVGLLLGTRYGWIWGLVAGFVAWGVVSATVVLSACVASGANEPD